MKRQYSVYLGLIALLAVVNLWRWWPHPGTGTEESAARGKVFLPEDFRLRVDLPAAIEPRRNLFQPRGGTFRTNTTHARQGVAQPPVLSGQNEAIAEGGLGKLKLLGVVFRAGKGQAYLALDKESVIAHAGDTVLGQFAVDKIAVDAVELRDLKTNTIRRIPVSGK